MLTLFLMNYKGLSVLKAIHSMNHNIIKQVISSTDSGVQHDYYEEIKSFCSENNLIFYNRLEAKNLSWHYAIAIGWKWLIADTKNLIVFHDSLLPKYRGFNPLVTALICGDKKIGVTALFASEKVDAGDIIAQECIEINYPIKIEKATELITDAYNKIALHLSQCIINNIALIGKAQDHTQATYSIWRDEKDYLIDWAKSAQYIKRHIDASGFPYTGACSSIDGNHIKILDAEEIQDCTIINRTPGKVFLIENQNPIVICGSGLLKLLHIVDSNNQKIILKKLRSRFV